MKVLIKGITGFAGGHLYRLLKEKSNVKLYGTYRHSSKNRNVRDSFNKVTLLESDVNDIYSIERVLSQVNPDKIFHFASYVSVHSSFNNPLPAFQTNIIGTAMLLEAVKKIVPQAKVLLPGSAEEYGIMPQDRMPIKESHPLNPVNPYGISKRVQEDLGLYYHRTFGLKIYFTRTFHYTGPGQPQGFVCSDFAKQVVDVEVGKRDIIKVGNLEARRDFTDIRDVVNAYWKIVDRGKVGEIYNVCYGRSIAVRDILNKLIKLSNRDILVEVDPKRLRPSDIPDFVGDNTKIRNIGWSPDYSIGESLKDLLEGGRSESKNS